MTSKYKYIYIEDKPNNTQSQRIVRLLSNNRSECEIIEPPKFEDIGTLTGDAFITDGELAALVPFSGRTLASEIRRKYPDKAIILLTRRALFEDQLHPVFPKSKNTDFDLIVFKDELQNNPLKYTNQIHSLVEGFEQLNGIEKGEGWEVVKKVMKIESEDEIASLNDAYPPNKEGFWQVTETAEWMINTIIGFPGVLLDDLHAAAILGIAVDDFNTNAHIQELFEPAQYKGVFKEFGVRWWSSRLRIIAFELLSQADVDTFLSEGFIQSFYNVYDTNLKQSKCIWDGEPIADAVCYVLNQPVKYENSLPYFPDHRPHSMQQARVSRTAITTTNKVKQALFSPLHIETARDWLKQAENTQ